MDFSKIKDLYIGGVPAQYAYLNGHKIWERINVKSIMDSIVLWYDIKRQGATNENMAASPVLRDLSGNGHDATCYNFAWSLMSGIGGYSFKDLELWIKNTNVEFPNADFKRTISTENPWSLELCAKYSPICINEDGTSLNIFLYAKESPKFVLNPAHKTYGSTKKLAGIGLHLYSSFPDINIFSRGNNESNAPAKNIQTNNNQ